MSKEKVNEYKDRKANRKAEIAKAKREKQRNKIIGIAVLVIVIGGLAGALGLTGWNQYVNYRDSRPSYERTEMVVSDYTDILSVEETTAE